VIYSDNANAILNCSSNANGNMACSGNANGIMACRECSKKMQNFLEHHNGFYRSLIFLAFLF
jgi:hypothetical protein